MALARFPQPPVPPRPNYPAPNNQMMFMLLQIVGKIMQMMGGMFQGGGGQQYPPVGQPGGYGSHTPSPFNYFGGGGGGYMV